MGGSDSALISQIIDVLKTKVSEFKYNQWLKPARFSLSEGTLSIDVPNKFIRDWIFEHYLPLIRFEVSRLVGAETKIAIEIRPELAVLSESMKPSFDLPEGIAPAPAKLSEAPSRSWKGLNPKYSFEGFVVGNANQFSHAAALSVGENPGKTYNPLFIYGGVGLGKTHLLNAIGLKILKNDPKKRVISVTGEQFTNELINAIRYQTTHEFRKKYRETCDVLLLDDVQFLAGKERTQEEFFHTFNTLYESRRQVVLTSDRAPKDITQLEERLRSRFNWGLIADIQRPDTETRVAIIKKRADAIGVEISDNVAYFMAEKVESNIRDLEGAFTRVSAFALLYKCAISRELVIKILQDIVADRAPLLSFDRIQASVADHFKIKAEELRSDRRFKAIAEPRQIAMYLCKKLLKSSFPEIGRQFGGKDHSTVMHAVKKIEREIELNPVIQESIFTLEKNLNA